jgi:hypothetical protein
MTSGEVLTLLRATAERIRRCAKALTEAQLHARAAPGEWSANEVLAHIRACADARGGCIPVIIAEDGPTLRAINPRTWMKKTDYVALDFWPSFEAFARQRAELLALLAPLPPEGWARAATVTGAGKPLQRTVLSYAGWVAMHERPHVKQIERIAEGLRA